MSDYPRVTGLMKRTNDKYSDDVIFNLGMDEGSGEVFTDKVTGAYLTNVGTADYTAVPHFPTVGVSDAASFTHTSSTLLTAAAGDVLIMFCGMKVSPPLASLAQFSLGSTTGSDAYIGIDATNATFITNGGNIGSGNNLAKSTLVANDVYFFAIVGDVTTGVHSLYESINGAGASKKDTITPDTSGGIFSVSTDCVVGSETIQQPVNGCLIYKKQSIPTDAEMLVYLDEHVRTWGAGHKVLQKALA